MKTLETIAKRVVCILLLLTGAVLVVLWAWECQLDTLRTAVREAAAAHGTLFVVWPGIGILLLAVGLLGLLSRQGAKAPVKSISYPGIRGDIVIELEWVEATLNRVIGKLREVKWIAVSVDPDEERGKASVTAQVKLVKGTNESARETANRVSSRLAETAANLLGVDEVTRVDLIVKGGGLQNITSAPAAAQPPKPAKAPETAPPAHREAEPMFSEEPAPPAEVSMSPDDVDEPKAAEDTPAAHHEPNEETSDDSQPRYREGMGEFPHGNG